MRTVLLAITLAASIPTAFADDKADPAGPPPGVFDSWVHSFEDDKGAGGPADVKTYRAKGYKFPPARGRAGFEIKKDGTFVDRPIAPADGNLAVPGTWTAAGPKKLKVSLPKRKSFVLEIVSYEDGVLKVKRTAAD